MALTFDPIATVTLGSTATEITFSSIPQTHTDLCLIAGIKMSGSFPLYCRVNGVSSGTYGAQAIQFDGSSTTSEALSGSADGFWLGGAIATSYPIALVLDIPSYRNTGVLKTGVCHYGGAGNTFGRGGIVNSVNTSITAAVTSLTLRNTAGQNFLVGSFATLYGITGA